jgi:hypothetical protein
MQRRCAGPARASRVVGVRLIERGHVRLDVRVSIDASRARTLRPLRAPLRHANRSAARRVAVTRAPQTKRGVVRFGHQGEALRGRGDQADPDTDGGWDEAEISRLELLRLWSRLCRMSPSRTRPDHYRHTLHTVRSVYSPASAVHLQSRGRDLFRLRSSSTMADDGFTRVKRQPG